MIPYIIVGVVAYLLGCIHPSYLLCRIIKNTDIREQGSKNSGTSNATMVLGLKYGVLTAIVDVLKGSFAVWIAGWLYGTINPSLLYFAGFCAILGHMFPFYMKFKGGKGLATLMGIAIPLHFYMVLVMFIFLVAVTVVTDYIVLGTGCACIIFFVWTFVLYGFAPATLLAAVIAFGILYKHRINFVRIRNKEEFKVSQAFKKEK